MRSRTRLRFPSASILALISALFGCGLTTNLDGLSGGGTAGANVEAGPEASDEAGEASLEAAPEASADSGAEATDAGDDADDGADDASDGEADAPDAEACPVDEGADYCQTIPRLATPTQLIDGIGDEFCPRPGMRLAPDTAQYWQGNVTADSHALARMAWSPEGLHLHFQVFQSDVVVPAWDGLLWHGDAVELLLKGDANLSGAFDGVNDPGAVQLLFLPPASDGDPSARAALYLNAQYVEAYDSSQYSSRVTPDGYAIEVRIPWAFVGGGNPGSGDQVALNWALDYHSRLVADRLWQLFAHYTDVPGGVVCTGGLVEPACDDRTWCTPTLE